MRKAQKKQIEDMIGLLDGAHSEIKKAVETGSPETALTLLEQCQDGAIQIGSLIENTEGEGFITIGMLESYCEQVYQTHEMIRQQQSVNMGKAYKKLRRELIRIDNSVRNDIKIRTVVAFLPYKASMWDSLESVWRAADEDPDCDAYVIPIPYYDKNPDGSFGKMNYEGYEYPKYVPIVSWEKFDISVVQPDIIFIHNPYDEFNIVTSVPPAYFSRELKKYTEKLVYIPYFVLGEEEVGNRVTEENLKHYCALPAVLNADKVIVQSKKVRQLYIDVMSKVMGEETRKVWEDKISGLGSPKIEKALNTQTEELDIPEEWEKIIRKPDGSRKKVIFYNTSVTSLLQQSEKMLEKMEYVFSVFQKSKDEVALLWRPHPLIKATVSSMLPQLGLEYEKIVQKYRTEGWGIYDDSADVDRAIALSDGYYGDHSSLVEMYKRTGKPILMQNVEVSGEEAINDEARKLKLNFLAGVQVGEEIFFSAWNINGLFRYNPQTEQCRFLKSFPWEESWGLHSEAILYQNSIWFIPRASERIAIVDLESLDITYLELPECGYRTGGGNIPPRRMMGCHKEGEKFLWLIPYSYRLFIKIDMDKRQIIEMQEWSAEGPALAMGVRVQDKLWVNIYASNEIRVIDVETGEQKVKKIEGENLTYIGIQSIGGKILLFSVYAKEGVAILNSDMQIEKIVYLDDSEQWYYEYLAQTEENDMLLVPYVGSKYVRIGIDEEGCFIRELKDLEEKPYCSAKLLYQDEIWFLSHVTKNPVICYNKKENVFYYRHIEMNLKQYMENVKKVVIKEGIEYSPLYSPIDEAHYSLPEFFSLTQFTRRAEGEEEMGKKNPVGKNIYETLRRR